MLIQTLFFTAFCNSLILKSSSITIGKLIDQIYIPIPVYISSETSLNYLNSCDECLCYAISSTTASYVALNCLTNTRICLFYENYTTNYSFQWNSSSYVYFFELPPRLSVTTTSTSTTSSSTSRTTSTTITSTTSTTSTTTATPFRLITSANDIIVAIYNATAGGSSQNSTPGSGVGQYVPGQGPTVCIDFSSSTCLNFGNTGVSGTPSIRAGVGTGVYTIPIVGVSVVRSIQFQTGADIPARDPLNITLEGSNAIGSALSVGSSWILLYSGATGLLPFNVTRSAWGTMQNFTNTRPFTAYRMIVTAQRAIDYCTQFAEMHLFGFI